MPLVDIIQIETSNGESKTVGDLKITPQSKAVSIRWPYVGFVWNRPVALLVEQGGRCDRIAITDVTRAAQLALYGQAILFTIITLLLSVRRSS